MPEFKWVGKDQDGKEVKGVMMADNADLVRLQLRRQKITPSKVKPKLKDVKIVIPGLSYRVKDRDLVVFTRTFATMVDAGLPLVQCLEILSTQTENPVFAKAINDIRQNVESGSTYADALRKHPKIFSELYCNMVEAGETGGILDTILNRLSAYMEASITLKRQIKSAMVYPIAIMTVALLVVILMMWKVLPTFAKIFVQLGSTLPLPTRIVIGISEFVQSYIALIILAIIGLIIGIRQFYKTEKGARLLDAVLLKTPVFGPLLRKVAVAKFTRTLGTLISSGVPILDGLEITAKTAGNKVIEEAVMKTRVSISEGKSISDPLAQTEVFPAMVVQMIAVGESTGALDSMLDKIADFYDEEVDIAVSNLTKMLEPLIMMFLGVVIGGLVLAMYLPMFKMIGDMSQKISS
ncbi:type II secretion system F family protein [bacterium]|nr:type II secretion system F family protein [candidate division CSSED10-310 bacterium]